MNVRVLLLGAAVFAGCLPVWAGERASLSNSAASMKRKLHQVDLNAASAHPKPLRTVFTETEVNAYMASGEVQLPAGVMSVHLEGDMGVITGTARVDFDQLRAGRGSANPLLEIFSGIHDVVVVAHARGSGGQGTAHVDSVSLDGIEIPRFVLELFVEKYLQPKYPGIGLDSRFDLPDRIDAATVGSHTLSVTQH